MTNCRCIYHKGNFNKSDRSGMTGKVFWVRSFISPPYGADLEYSKWVNEISMRPREGWLRVEVDGWATFKDEIEFEETHRVIK